MKKLFFILLLFCLLFTVSALAEISGFYEYSVKDNGTAIISKYNGFEFDVEIPSEIDGYRVSEIGENAFSENILITNLIIPDGVISIGKNAFSSCDQLEKIAFPNTLKFINERAFFSCKNLSSITIPGSCELIGNDAFMYCDLSHLSIQEGVKFVGDEVFGFNKYLSSVSLPNSIEKIGRNPFICCDNLATISIQPKHPIFAVIDGVLFEKESKKLISYPIGNGKYELSIPDGIKIIGAYSFKNASYLELTIPSSVTTIEDEAFSGSKVELIIPKSVVNIGPNPFLDCSNYKISISDDHPFLVYMNGTLYDNEQKKIISFGSTSFPDNIEIIGSKAYWGDFFIENLDLPDTLTTIEDEAFALCYHLKSLTIPKSVSYIGKDVFKFSNQLTIGVYQNSYAEEYCKENNLPYSYIDDDLDWLQ